MFFHAPQAFYVGCAAYGGRVAAAPVVLPFAMVAYRL